MSKIQDSIQRLFQQHRVLIWYDADQKFIEEFQSLNIPDGEKISIKNNELAIKYEVLLRQSGKKYLLYVPKPRPDDIDNWLLDLELAFHVYHTDQQALFLQELGLGYHLKEWITNHLEFFQNKQRLQRFAQLLDPDDSETVLTVKLIQVVFGSEHPQLETFLRQYAATFVQDKHKIIEKELDRFGLKETFWRGVSQRYGYNSDEPGIYDFLIGAFTKNFTLTASQSRLNKETGVLLSNWKDAKSFEETFSDLSDRIQRDLGIGGKLDWAAIEEVLSDDLFELVDRRIISELVSLVISDAIDHQRLDTILKRRQSKYWYHSYQHFYRAIEEGFLLLQIVRRNDNLAINDFGDGLQLYTKSLYEADQRYRKFIEHYRLTNQNNALNSLYNHTNKAYSNTWLLKLGNCWQQVIDKQLEYPYSDSLSQRLFFKRDVKPFCDDKKKLFVIISDALRYECGAELYETIQKENRFSSNLTYQFASLPSYTQLGMASLLPHNSIEFDGQSDDILIDGQRTKGIDARKRILQRGTDVRATTIDAEDFMKLASKSQEAIDLITRHDLIYIYHNRIDKVGDEKTTEEKVIDAVREEIPFLIELARKIKNMNGNNILITADHGFLYQNDPLEESDFIDADITGDVYKFNRRFVLGTRLKYKTNAKFYHARQLGIDSDIEVLIPKSINRLRVSGAGSRYIHGGASLQELVLPVLHVSIKRENTISKVDIDILNKTNTRISTNLQGVQFYQTKPVGEQLLGRPIKAFFRSEDGEVISDVFNFTFNSESPNASDREKHHGFQISSKASTQFKNKTVFLILEEQIVGTSTWIEYQKYSYTVNISFTSDFDDF